jgi:hypothetical protein
MHGCIEVPIANLDPVSKYPLELRPRLLGNPPTGRVVHRYDDLHSTKSELLDPKTRNGASCFGGYALCRPIRPDPVSEIGKLVIPLKVTEPAAAKKLLGDSIENGEAIDLPPFPRTREGQEPVPGVLNGVLRSAPIHPGGELGLRDDYRLIDLGCVIELIRAQEEAAVT